MDGIKSPTEEISYRKELLARKYSSLSELEKVWLQTHTVYSEMYGYPFIRAMAIQIEPNTVYSFTVKFIKRRVSQRVTPTIFIPMEKGYIYVDGETIDQTGKIFKGNKCAMLSTNSDEKNPTCTHDLLSETGVFCVFFHATILRSKLPDPRFKSVPPSERLMPSITIPYFCMNCTKMSANRLRFSCSIAKDKFSDDYEFEIEWTAQ